MLAQEHYRRHRLLARDYLIAVGLFVGYLTLLVNTMDMGFTRDEGYYFYAAEQYYGWFAELEANREAGHPEDSFTRENIDRHWSANPEHPVLMKTLFGLSWHELSQERHWLSPSSAMRLPSAVVASLLMAWLFLFGVEAFGSRLVGLFAVIALGFQPRFFFHAHLACFDVPITALWVLVVYAYWRSYNSRLWAWLTGAFFGLALITKLNAFFLPVVLVLHWLVAGWRRFGLQSSEGRWRLTIPPIPRAFLSMALLGPLIFYMGWPLHWFDTFNRIAWYISRHWHHEHYYVYYFGEALVRPPFPVTFPLVMTAVTVPVIFLLAAALGGGALIGEWIQGRRASPMRLDGRATGVLLLLNLLFPILLIARPETPVFGGTKHWMSAMPFLALLSGVGVNRAFEQLWASLGPSRRWLWAAALAAFTTLLSLPAVHATWAVHPYGTSYYNEAVGGVRGAADRELMRQYWGYATRAGLGFMRQQAPADSRIFPHNANPDAMHWYRVEGWLGEDTHDVWDPARAEYAFFNHQKAFIPVALDIWRAVGTMAAVAVWEIHGVPVFSIYGDRPAQLRHPWPDDDP